MTLTLIEHANLQHRNTLALSATARYFTEVTDEGAMVEAYHFAYEHKVPLFILGEGSNIVLRGEFPGLMVKNNVRGMALIAEDSDSVTLEVGSGENWHQLVVRTLGQSWFGLENLALIPGTVGAAPVQNIGAYGVEIAQFVVAVRAWDTREKRWTLLNNADCRFAYRDSLFKHEPGRYLISAVQLRLLRCAAVNLRYQALRDTALTTHNENTMTPQDVFDTVVALRRARLPDPAVIPNAGSFFKNPVVTMTHYQILLEKFPALVSYPVDAAQRKLAAAWLIDQAGWKGVCEGRVGVHDQQALVLVNRGGATGAELLAFAQKIAADVFRRYEVTLELEPVVV